VLQIEIKPAISQPWGMISQGYGIISQPWERFPKVTKPFPNIGKSQINIGKWVIQDQNAKNHQKRRAGDENLAMGMFWRGSRQPGAGVFNKTANVAALMSLALTRSSRREEAPTNTPAIEKSLVTLAATAGQERSSPLARWYFSVACLADPDVSISTKPGQPHLMSLAIRWEMPGRGSAGRRPGEGFI
jgi:hypothetical protein